MNPNQLRQAYLNFFKQRDHAIVPSAPIVPENDPTTLFTGSGMQPMLPYLLGESHPLGTRIVDSQRCFRSVDIEEVGDNSHTTYFEMLGNWSFGDYFKQEQLTWIYQFLIETLKFDPKRLYATVYAGNKQINVPQDEEAITILSQIFTKHDIKPTRNSDPETDGFTGERIHLYGDSDNWWSRAGEPENMPIGEPGGPTSEIFYDFGADRRLHEQSEYANRPCHVNCDCGRFLEICNSVFMAYIKTKSGFTPLENKNIDFGGGFERILATLNDDPDVYKTELFMPIIKMMESVSKQSYDTPNVQRSFRVIADHIRSAVMFGLDDIYPSNKDQGYFARRMIRRAIRYAKMIGIDKPFIADLVPIVVEIYKEPYPALQTKQATITKQLTAEEAKFRKTLHKGIKQFNKLVKSLDSQTISGKDAFFLYETFGFPLEITQEMASEHKLDVDVEGFTKAKKDHAKQSRTASAGKFKGGLADHSHAVTKLHTATHLLNQALRDVLGDHVSQAGSNITGERLRFDFTHPDRLTQEQRKQIQDQINQAILADYTVTWKEMETQQALNQGVVGVFGEKYADKVKVYTIGPKDRPYSQEICGGPHVEKTGKLGTFTLGKEKAIGAGKRRIYGYLE